MTDLKKKVFVGNTLMILLPQQTYSKDTIESFGLDIVFFSPFLRCVFKNVFSLNFEPQIGHVKVLCQ
jgi:hypothetical protein